MTDNNSKIHTNFWAKAFFALGSVIGAAGYGAGSASAASLEVLHSFCQQTNCADGKLPAAALIIESTGNLYGTATEGGGPGCSGFGCGVMFFLSATKAYHVLHTFGGSSFSDGAGPRPLLGAGGNLFGTTSGGGASNDGTVFIRSASGYAVVHSFTGTGTDGSEPLAGLIADSSGNFYGTTEFGGGSNRGTIFKIAPGGTISTLYSFCSMTNCSDGSEPAAGLFLENGNLYGTTQFGGGATGCFQGCGVVFEITTTGNNYTVLHTFVGPFLGGSDGANPAAGLTPDASGNLYGTTEFGGASGVGNVFKIATNGSNYAVLYNFCSLANCADGADPTGRIILDANGNLYSTGLNGGEFGLGVVFALTPSGSERVLYSFCHTQNSNGFCLDGEVPEAGVVADGSGNLYGTTGGGGAMNQGTVYKLTNTGFVP